MSLSLIELYNKLLATAGPQDWWPGDTQDEIIIGAILTQSVAWTNVEKALANLKQAGINTLEDIHMATLDDLAHLIRPTLYYNQKARKLKNFAAFFVEQYQADFHRLFSQNLPKLRAQLLSIKGLGPETVDSILLYAGNVPVFVCDAYTNRLMQRLGFAREPRGYEYWQSLFMAELPCDPALYNDFHAQIVVHCKDICKSVPRCDQCGLQDICPSRHLGNKSSKQENATICP